MTHCSFSDCRSSNLSKSAGYAVLSCFRLACLNIIKRKICMDSIKTVLILNFASLKFFEKKLYEVSIHDSLLSTSVPILQLPFPSTMHQDQAALLGVFNQCKLQSRANSTESDQFKLVCCLQPPIQNFPPTMFQLSTIFHQKLFQKLFSKFFTIQNCFGLIFPSFSSPVYSH